MFYQLVLILQLMVMSINTLPLEAQFLQPLHQHVPLQPAMQQVSLQQQLLALQQLQALQRLTVHSPSEPYFLQPLLILLPNPTIKKMVERNDIFKKDNQMDSKDNELKHKNSDNEYTNENIDSVITDAAPDPAQNVPHRAMVLLPNGRFSIGEFISGISWLPFEINVPDTVSWAYNGISNGISGIISIIRPQMSAGQETSVKMFLRQLQMRNQNPLMQMMVLPIDTSLVPLQI